MAEFQAARIGRADTQELNFVLGHLIYHLWDIFASF